MTASAFGFPLRVHPDPKCDFCSTPQPTLVVHCETLVQFGKESDLVLSPDWAACSPCYVLFEAREFDKLADRSIATWPYPLPPGERKSLHRLLVGMHKAARAAMLRVDTLRPDTLAR